MTNETLEQQNTRLREELAELTAPESTYYACAACGFAGEGFLTVEYCDEVCPKCESAYVYDTIQRALHCVIGERDEAVSRADAAEDGSVDMLRALLRAERKLSAYVGVCKGDKELTDTVLPMLRAITHIGLDKARAAIQSAEARTGENHV